MMIAKNRNVMLNSVFCDAICVSSDPRHLEKFPRKEILVDKMGLHWCPEHRNRGELLNWAVEHDFPAIMFTGQMRYAIGVERSKHNDDLWKAVVLTGSDDIIQAAIQSVMGDDEVPQWQS
jgi:hypothetical protein